MCLDFLRKSKVITLKTLLSVSIYLLHALPIIKWDKGENIDANYHCRCPRTAKTPTWGWHVCGTGPVGHTSCWPSTWRPGRFASGTSNGAGHLLCSVTLQVYKIGVHSSPLTVKAIYTSDLNVDSCPVEVNLWADEFHPIYGCQGKMSQLDISLSLSSW